MQGDPQPLRALSQSERQAKRPSDRQNHTKTVVTGLWGTTHLSKQRDGLQREKTDSEASVRQATTWNSDDAVCCHSRTQARVIHVYGRQ